MTIEPSDAQVSALALPGDDWFAGRRRAKRILNSVCECRPCPVCALGGDLDDGLCVRGWIDDDKAMCRYCSGYLESVEEFELESALSAGGA